MKKYFLGLTLILILLAFSASGFTNTFTYNGDFATAFPNPERGFHCRYEIIDDPSVNDYADNSIPGFTPDMLDRTFARAKGLGNTLIHSYIHLDKYKTSPLPQALLDNLSSGLAAIRSAGLKIVLRPAYEWSGSPSVLESQIISHTEQLYPVIAANADVVLHLEAGWLGPWGEWHDALYCAFFDRNEADTRYRLVKKILSLTPSNIPVCIRYPIFLKELWYMTDNNMVPSGTTALTIQERDRLGFHNDAFLADSADCGTYDNPSWMGWYYIEEKRQWMYDMATSQGFNQMMGGESMDSSGNNDLACNNVQSEMALLNTTELNEDYAKVNTDIWKAANLAASGNDPAETAFVRIKRKMGYRFRLVDATFPTAAGSGGSFTISANLNNDGYAGPIKPRPFFLVLDGPTRVNIQLTNVDVRSWLSGVISMPQQVVTLPAGMPSGTYKLALWLPDQAANLRSRPEYSIRFANLNTWDATNGYNVLSNSIAISGGGQSTPTPTPTAGPTPTPTAGPTPTLTPIPVAPVTIDSFSDQMKWLTNKLNDLNQNISWVMDSCYYGSDSCGNIVMNSSPSGQYYQENINQSIFGNSNLVLRLRDWADTDTENHWNIILNDGSDHIVGPLSTYGNVTGSYTDITIPLSAFNANLANAKYLRLVHKDSTYAVLLVDSIKISGSGSTPTPTPIVTATPTPTPIVTATPTPTITVTPTPTPTDGMTYYEAESSNNTLSGTAVVTNSSGCSGGKKVGYLGNGSNNYVIFNSINVSSSGTYIMTIYYLTAETRTFNISVNGGSGLAVTCNSSGGWNTVGTITATVSLNAGNNTIKFYNNSAYCPDLDRIGLNVPDTQGPTTPTGLVASNVATTSLSLSWTASTDNVGVTGYNIYRNGTQIGSSTTTNYNDNGLTADTTYSYTVKAKDAAGNISAASAALSIKTTAPDTQAPTVPTNLAVTHFTDTTVNLSWTAAMDNVGVAFYEIYRNSVKVNTATGVTYTDSGLNPSTTYSYAVKAVDSSNNASGLSAAVTVTTQEAIIDPDNDNITLLAGVPPFRFSPSPDAGLAVHNLTEGVAPVDNPLKGILYWWFKNDNPDLKPTPFSMEWHYFGLGDLMIGPDSYNWEPMEEFLDQVAAHGRQACLRISTNISFGGKDVPTFLQDLPLTDGNLPYDNPRVISAFSNFIRAFGAKYDGDPRIGFITMGLVGKWGEWHTWPYEGGDNGNPDLMPTKENCEIIINAYNTAFKITSLEIRYPRVAGGTLLTSLGRIGYHDDSFGYKENDPLLGRIGSMTLPLSMGGKTDALVTQALQYGAENKWITASIGGEVRPEIQGQFVDPPNQTKDDPMDDIEVAHATWMMCNQAGWPASNTPAMNVLRRFGYNLVVRNAYFNSAVSGTMKVGVRIENTGVAPFYYGPDTWPVIIGLKDGNGNVVATWTTDWSLKKVKPSKIRALPEWNIAGNPKYIDFAEPYYFDTTVNLNGIANGSYTLVMRVKNPLEELTMADLADHNDFSWQPYKEPKKLYFANQEQNTDGWLRLGNIQVN